MLDYQDANRVKCNIKQAEGRGKPLSYFPSTVMEQNLKLIEMDNVNEGSNREPSSGRGAHDPQVTLDRHQATADNCKRKSKVKPVKIAT